MEKTKSKNSLISVIIPTYNYGSFITDTLNSVLNQTYNNLECIVVDDGSTDNTEYVVGRFIEKDNRIKYFYQNNAGQASARNNGLQVANGRYIQFLDADDLLESQKLERQVEFLEKHSDIGIVYGETRYFRTECPEERRFSMNKPDSPWMPKISGKGAELIKKIIEQNIFTISSPLIRRNIIDLIGGFDNTLNPVEDWDYWMRCAIEGISIKYLEAEDTKDLIRIHSLSATHNVRNADYKRFLMRLKFDRILPDEKLKSINLPFLNKSERSWLGGECIEGLRKITHRQFIEGINLMWETFHHNPPLFCRIATHRIYRIFSERTLDLRN